MNLQFFQNLPNPPDDPADDVNGMQTNSASAFAWPTVDHFGYKTSLGGYHNVIHQPTGAGTQNLTRSGVGAVYANTPANISGVNQFIAGQYTPDATTTSTDTQLFSLSGANIISQLTGNLSGIPSGGTLTDGYAWIGGILLQWGFISSTGGSGTVSFKDRFTGAIPFPNNCFMVNLSLSKSGAVLIGSLVASGSSVLTTGFNWTLVNVGGINGFYWLAIGN